jgi:hypothetical protein
MYRLAPDERTTPAMAYTANGLYRGEVVAKTNAARLLNWIRTANAPRYLHFTKVTVLGMGAGARPANYGGLFLPVADVIAFHLMPPATEPLDYEADEKNRVMADMTALVGSFVFSGKMRHSSQMDAAQSLEMQKLPWMSFYEVNISNPSIPQMTMQAPMVVLAPARIAIAYT